MIYCFKGANIDFQIFGDNNFLDNEHRVAALKEELFSLEKMTNTKVAERSLNLIKENYLTSGTSLSNNLNGLSELTGVRDHLVREKIYPLK